MKKVLFVLALGAFAACNDSGSSTEKKADTTSTAPAPDTTKMKMDSGANKMSTDTTKKDTAVKK